ncbi:MAG: DNA (cytosine-5-)-methyltransferase [Micrococcaceae bacterium]|nr:DNA (cytosine-5-)-methyltransferase [Micrococcaceae bacterium]
MKHMVGLFAGIGGIELGFHRAMGANVQTTLLCEWWDPAKAVLTRQFPDAEIHPDVRGLDDLPIETDLLSAGFPCTDLSQAGRTAGIKGEQSGLVKHLFDLLQRRVDRGVKLPTLLIENVPNMLALDKGAAMEYLVSELEALGYFWAYRVVDTRSTGLPQRRRRVLLVASTEIDPKRVLFSDEAQGRPLSDYDDNAFGFYWTEGRGGLGWAPDAIPTLKGGSTIGIASPPAIWVPDAEDPARALVVPREEDMESLQGFPRGWTDVDYQLSPARTRGTRGKMLGNAVSVRVAEWVASRIDRPGEVICPSVAWGTGTRWPNAAAGAAGVRERIEASEFPVQRPYEHLREHVDVSSAPALSLRAVAGFHSRLMKGNLGWHPGFREAVAETEQALVTSDLQQRAGA